MDCGDFRDCFVLGVDKGETDMIPYTYAIRNDRQAKGRETMTRDQAVEYLADGRTAGMTQADRDATIVEFAEDRGYYVGLQWIYDVEYAKAKRDGVADDEYFENYDGDGNIHEVAVAAVEWLTDQGLLPDGYGYDDERATDGYGIDTRGEGS